MFYPPCNVLGQCLEDGLTCLNHICRHKDLIPPSFEQLLGVVAISVFSGLGAVSGQGGSTPMPLLILLLHYPPKAAKFAIFPIILAAQMGSLCLMIYQHPKIIHTRLSFLVLPGMLAAGLLGALINAIMPEGVWMIGLVSISLLQVVKIYKGAIFSFRLETEVNKRQVAISLDQNSEEVEFELLFLGETFLVAVIVLVFVGLAGSMEFGSWVGIKFCSTYFWVLTILIVVTLELFASYNIEQDEYFSGRKSNILLKANLAGLFAASEGQPGGIFLTPLFGELGLSSKESSATSSLTLSIVAAINSFQALNFGALRMVEFIELYIAIFSGSLLITTAIYFTLKRLNRFSYLQFIQLGLVLTTICSALSIGFTHWFQKGFSISFFTGFKTICE